MFGSPVLIRAFRAVKNQMVQYEVPDTTRTLGTAECQPALMAWARALIIGRLTGENWNCLRPGQSLLWIAAIIPRRPLLFPRGKYPEAVRCLRRRRTAEISHPDVRGTQ